MRKVFVLLLFARALLAVSVTTGNYNVQRTNANTSETILTPSNATQLGNLGCLAVDDFVYAQPLVVDGVSIGGASRVVLIATMNDSIYLFNAAQTGSPGGNCTSSFIWKASVGTPQFGAANFGSHNMGCEATPVIDPSAAIVYAVCRNLTAWRVVALNISDGSAVFSPVVVAGSNNGVTFASTNQNCRPALLLLNGEIYFAFSAFSETTFEGWVFAASTTTGSIDHAWSSATSSANWSGIWMGGGGISTDGTFIYVTTGNGACNSSDTNYGEAVVKLTTSLAVQDFWSASNCGTESALDQDFSTAVILFGSQLITATKASQIILLNQSSLGGQGASPVQTISDGLTAFGALAFANSNCYFSGSIPSVPLPGAVKRYSFNGSSFTLAATSSVQGWFPGPSIGYTSSGSSNGIVWAITVPTGIGFNPQLIAGTLRALDATTLTELWNSDVAQSDAMGLVTKMSVPTIANGQIFVPTASNKVMVYGLATPAAQDSTIQGQVSISGQVKIQ